MDVEAFKLLMECKASNSILVKKYLSLRTGMQILTADVPGPAVHGYFIVATEAKDDDGLPHTLEHLIFLGSSDYPYKGTLDIIANRCLASGTNAWTEIDHTAYTVFTVSAEGFLALLPIYLDHLFFPTLTDAGFLTEVYHVTEEGKDSGVVFCEMQGRESSAECLTQIELMRALYPGDCGYRYETGGIVSNLRNSTSIDKVRKYHKLFYCPKNTTIVVTGKINETKLFSVIHEFEKKLIEKGSKVFEKAWQSPVPRLNQRNVRAVTYPSDHEDNGVVLIGWQGPSVVDEYYHVVASQILFEYMAETAASPLMKYFVETNDSFCSDISVTIIENSISAVYLTFENVVISKMSFLNEELMKLFNLIADNTDEDFKINGNRMNSVIRRFAMKQLLAFEKKPQNEITLALVGDVLYGKSFNDMFDRLNHEALAKRLLDEPISFWICLLKEYFIQRPYAMVLGYPSKKEHAMRSHFENERIKNRKMNLGPEGLKQKADALQKATEENEKLPPDDLIATVSVPSTENLNFHPIHRYTSKSEIQHPSFTILSAPVFTQLDDVDSKFVYVYVLMDSSKLSKEFRLYLPLFLEYILECPVKRNDELISYEKVAAQLEEDIVELKTSIGVKSDNRFTCGQYSFLTTLYMVMIHENFGKGMNWIRELLYQSIFTSDRLKVVTQKLINSISQIRRQPHKILKNLAHVMLFDPDTNYSLCTVLSQLTFLTTIAEKLQSDEQCQKIIQDLISLRVTLTNPDNMILHISTNVHDLISKCENPSECILKIIPENKIPVINRLHVFHDHVYLSPSIGKTFKSCVAGMATADSAFLCHSTHSIKDYCHPDFPALLVFIQYVTQLEGPMWRDIRGYGLSYGYDIILDPNEGVLYLTFYRATDVVQAFRRAKDIVYESINTAGKWNTLHFESAKSSLICEIVEREKNIADVSIQSVISYFRLTSENYSRMLIKKVNEVKQNDMKKVLQNYIAPLFDPNTSLSTIICHNTKCEEIAQSFSLMGYDLVQFPTLEDSYLNPSFINNLRKV